jgi:hypothetical protein
MTADRGKAPPGLPYNLFDVRKEDGGRIRPTAIPDAKTLAALEELEFISSWAEFVDICERQRLKRGY